MLGSNLRLGPRPPPKASVDALDIQLVKGEVQVNAALMSREELLEWAKRLKALAHKVTSLKILCLPRGLQWSQYHYANLQDRKAHVQHVYSLKEHKLGVQTASANVQHHIARTAFYTAVCAVLRRAPVTELVLGLRFSEGGYTMLSEALAANKTLKRLSLAGSHLGDTRFMCLKPGLVTNNSLEELDLTACNLSDAAALCVAGIIKAHADRRQALAFDEQLREYPDSSLLPHAAHGAFHARLRSIAASVDERCGGLLHLELAENKLTDKSARSLHDALSYDRRLIFLSLRANRLTAEAEREFIALMKEHQALLRVDLRQNPDPQLGILKASRAHGTQPHLDEGLALLLEAEEWSLRV
ncbi:hypothetical protein GPECTOR_6g822 [Gonium pectorale]|uniref:Uncharacterized protein n=1 Tax=Gonium pectorale TaxID=33097 RepID=A0A150GVS8_GONPE|nr:hypothetical protein GPECTOR_6g822 [Gonium pectorale]|eukprot:KXZ53904.1 hypothetical protein GPECTOR_6g822 [Gonium pectorale]